MAAEAGPPRSSPSPTKSKPESSGWTVSAAVALLIIGTLNVLWGLAATTDSELVAVGGRGVMAWTFAAWGWIHLVLGALLVLAGAGLLAMKEWARWIAVWFAGANAILQIGVITAFPLWSILIIALDFMVMYQLTERWERQFPRRPG